MMEGMLPGDWKRLETTIRVAVTRAIVQGLICIILLVFLIGGAWVVFTRLPWLLKSTGA